MEKHYMNKQRGRHMEPGSHEGGGKPHPHSVSIHHAGEGEPHKDNPHHVHVHHADGSHEHSDHNSFEEAMDHANSLSGDSEHDGETMAGEHEEPDGDEHEDAYGL